MTLSTSNSSEHHPLHFDLGVDVLASGVEMQSLPHDWDPHESHAHGHDHDHWEPSDPGQMQIWAATLDVPGF